MIRLTTFLLFFACSTTAVLGQLKVNASTLNYGKVEVWKNDTLEIQIKNRAKTSAKILPTYNPDVQLIGPREIAPGATVVYRVVAYPRTKGYFEFKPQYFFSNSNDPVVFIIKGQIKTFDESALYQCPRLEHKPRKFELPSMLIKVVDTFTNKIIYHAEAELYNPLNRIQFDGGYMNIITHFGNYGATAQAQGYEAKNIAFLFDSKNQEIIIKLRPIEPLDEEMDEEWEEEKEVNEDEYITLDDVNPDKETKKQAPEVILKEEKKPEEQEKKPVEVVIKKKDKEMKPDTFPDIVVEKQEKPIDPLVQLGKEYQQAKLGPQHIIILADVSFSMQRSGYLQGLKDALLQTVKQLRPQDSLTIITFSSTNTVLADHIGVSERDSITEAILNIKAKGGTNAKIALKSAYGVTKRYESQSTRTQVILFTDGKFNTPGTPGGWYGNYVDQKYNSASMRLNILTFSSRQTDFLFLSAISSKTGGKTRIISQDIALEMLKVLMSK